LQQKDRKLLLGSLSKKKKNRTRAPERSLMGGDTTAAPPKRRGAHNLTGGPAYPAGGKKRKALRTQTCASCPERKNDRN